MPKVKELGVTVVPQEFGPNEIGAGGGGAGGACACSITNPCIGCTGNFVTYYCRWFTKWGCGRFSGCTDCTTVPYSICGTTPGICTDCTRIPYSICGTTPVAELQCRVATLDITTIIETPCGGSYDPIRPGGLTLQDISALREQLQAQMKALDEAEKNYAPQMAAQIDAREKQLNEELESLKKLRSELKKK